MAWGINDVPGVTHAEDSTLTEWRHRQEQRGRHPHQRPPHQQPHPQPPARKPEGPAAPDPVDPSQVHHLNILA